MVASCVGLPLSRLWLLQGPRLMPMGWVPTVVPGCVVSMETLAVVAFWSAAAGRVRPLASRPRAVAMSARDMHPPWVWRVPHVWLRCCSLCREGPEAWLQGPVLGTEVHFSSGSPAPGKCSALLWRHVMRLATCAGSIRCAAESL